MVKAPTVNKPFCKLTGQANFCSSNFLQEAEANAFFYLNHTIITDTPNLHKRFTKSLLLVDACNFNPM